MSQKPDPNANDPRVQAEWLRNYIQHIWAESTYNSDANVIYNEKLYQYLLLRPESLQDEAISKLLVQNLYDNPREQKNFAVSRSPGRDYDKISTEQMSALTKPDELNVDKVRASKQPLLEMMQEKYNGAEDLFMWLSVLARPEKYYHYDLTSTAHIPTFLKDAMERYAFADNKAFRRDVGQKTPCRSGFSPQSWFNDINVRFDKKTLEDQMDNFLAAGKSVVEVASVPSEPVVEEPAAAVTLEPVVAAIAPTPVLQPGETLADVVALETENFVAESGVSTKKSSVIDAPYKNDLLFSVARFYDVLTDGFAEAEEQAGIEEEVDALFRENQVDDINFLGSYRSLVAAAEDSESMTFYLKGAGYLNICKGVTL